MSQAESSATTGTVTSAPKAVEIRSLTKVFPLPWKKGKGVLAVDDVDLDVGVGDVYGLIGPNGSGKSTIMKALLGLVNPTSGTTRIFGQDSTEVTSRRDVGYLPENPYFYKHLTGAETVRFYAQLCGLKRRDQSERTEELLELVGLKDAGSRRLAGYSKGMLQRIGLAQALVQRPRLLVLDEPTAGVDPVGSRRIRDLIFNLKKQGISIFLCSHLLEQVQQVCDRVGIIHRGRIVREGAIEDLISIEDQSEVLLRNASPELLESIKALVAAESATELVRIGNPKTTLEHLFLKATGSGRDVEESAEDLSESSDPS